MTEPSGEVGWRVFPWDPGAPPGSPFSPTHVPRVTGRGRFDLSRARSRVLYLAESPEHAVAEVLHPWRGTRLDERHLSRAGRRLATVRVELHDCGAADIADLCDPDLLAGCGIAPDRVASRHRSVTQPIAAALWELGYMGLRWWSRFWGDWHTWALFAARFEAEPRWGEPEPLELGSPALLEAARMLGAEVAGT